MKFTFRKSDFLQSIFPGLNLTDNEAVKNHLMLFYTKDGQIPKVDIDGDLVQVSLPTNPGEVYPNDFYRATDLCMKGMYNEAIPIFENLISKEPRISEYHRNLGQAYEELGNYPAAIDSLIEALRWNPKNNWALLLMGNIYVKTEKDFKTALTYFDQIVESDPDNFLALSNIGGTFLQAEKPALAESFFKRAVAANPGFPNAMHGLGIIESEKGNLLEAFDLGISALKSSDLKDKRIRQVLEGFVFNVASQYSKKEAKMDLAIDFISELEKLSGKEIQLKTDSSLPVEAKIEIAENYNRDYHLVHYRPEAPRVEHLICHELTHLKYILEARAIDQNQLFTSGDSEFTLFQKLMDPAAKQLKSDGVTDESVKAFVNHVFHGLNSRIYNAPIDLFIEDYLYYKKKELRPQQLISLVNMDKLSLQAVTDPEIIKVTPALLLSKIKVYNAITAKQIDQLFGTDLESRYPLNPKEKAIVNRF